MQTKDFLIFLDIKFLYIFSAYMYFFRDQSDYANLHEHTFKHMTISIKIYIKSNL